LKINITYIRGQKRPRGKEAKMIELIGNIIFFASLGALIFIFLAFAIAREEVRQEQEQHKEVTG